MDLQKSVPGIGPINGRVLANELGNMKQFHSEKRLFSHTGLTPSEHSSGEHTRLGHITRQGNPILHDLVVLDCVSIIHRNHVLKFGARSL